MSKDIQLFRLIKLGLLGKLISGSFRSEMKVPRFFMLACLLCAVMLSPVVEAGLNYATINGSITIIPDSCVSGGEIIPSTINGLAVTSIAGQAFFGCTSLESVTIPNSITSIGAQAFYNCTSLSRVTIGTNVTSIGGGAFYNCASLSSITIPKSVTHIGDYSFSGCTKLTAISVYALNPAYSSVGGVLFDRSQSTIIQYPGGIAGSYLVPSSVTSIAAGAFEYCQGLTSISMTSGVTSIGNGAFFDCTSLTNVAIPDSVTSIGGEVFSGCSSLTAIMVELPNTNYSSVDGVLFDGSQSTIIQYPCGNGRSYVIPSSVTSIGDYAFAGCASLTNITIPGSVTNIGNSAFDGCTSLTGIEIPSSVTAIGDSAFGGCTNVASITIPSSVISIGDGAFYGCMSLPSITIPTNITTIGDSTFELCSSLKSVTIPNSVTGIWDDAFYGCSGLTNVTMGTNVSSIGSATFELCSSLTSITIPNSVTSIANWAFGYCTSLTAIYAQGSTSSTDSTIFGEDSLATIYYWPGTAGWIEFAANAGIPAVLLGPQVQASGASFGIQTNQFGFNVNWASGQTVVVEFCTDLDNSIWFPLATNVFRGSSFYFSDSQWTNSASRFYRVVTP